MVLTASGSRLWSLVTRHIVLVGMEHSQVELLYHCGIAMADQEWNRWRMSPQVILQRSGWVSPSCLRWHVATGLATCWNFLITMWWAGGANPRGLSWQQHIVAKEFAKCFGMFWDVFLDFFHFSIWKYECIGNRAVGTHGVLAVYKRSWSSVGLVEQHLGDWPTQLSGCRCRKKKGCCPNLSRSKVGVERCGEPQTFS